jgi:hypothetical protein
MHDLVAHLIANYGWNMFLDQSALCGITKSTRSTWSEVPIGLQEVENGGNQSSSNQNSNRPIWK